MRPMMIFSISFNLPGGGDKFVAYCLYILTGFLRAQYRFYFLSILIGVSPFPVPLPICVYADDLFSVIQVQVSSLCSYRERDNRFFRGGLNLKKEFHNSSNSGCSGMPAFSRSQFFWGVGGRVEG